MKRKINKVVKQQNCRRLKLCGHGQVKQYSKYSLNCTRLIVASETVKQHAKIKTLNDDGKSNLVVFNNKLYIKTKKSPYDLQLLKCQKNNEINNSGERNEP